MSGKLRIGFVGAGGIAIGHYQRLAATKKAEVTALNEPSDASLQQFYKHCPGSESLPVYRDYRDMLRNEKLDGVVILSPHTVHYEQTTAALKKGLHVLSEKPMVCTIKHAKALIALAKQTKRTLMISYQRHFEPTFRYMREQIAKGRLGEVQFVQAIQAQEWLRLTRGTWRQDPALSGGGQLNDSGSHLLDIILWCSGLVPAEVFAYIDNLDSQVDILTAASVKFTNGALGTLSVNGNGIGFYEDITFYCDEGAFYMRQGKLTEQNRDKGLFEPTKMPKGTDPDTNWIDAILGKAEMIVPAVCGLRVIQLTEAAWKSGKSGRPSKVKLSELDTPGA